MRISDIQKQKAEWKRKGWSIPELRGSKQDWFQIVTELVSLIGKTPVVDLNLFPEIRNAGSAYSWRTYAPFLKGVGLVSNRSGVLSLSEIGTRFMDSRSKTDLATLLHDKYRLVGEVLAILESSNKTIEEVDSELCRNFCLDWSNLSNTRRRMDWLEVLDLIQPVGNRRWGLTEDGKNMLEKWLIVGSEVVEGDSFDLKATNINPPPPAIKELLDLLRNDPSLQNKRNTYNVSSPSPNKIENLRTIIQFASEKITRTDLFAFIEEEFNLKTSSVESMMPFLKADGLLEEVGRNIYVATTAAKEWCESGNDLDFIRILHAHKRFVGEMIAMAESVVSRNDIYAEAKKYGLNTEKSRWITAFLLEAGLLEETQYLHVKATPLGISFLAELPLMLDYPNDSGLPDGVDSKGSDNSALQKQVDDMQVLFDSLSKAARDPMAEGKASGMAFEEAISSVFSYMGFEAKRIGGSGNTDVVLRWKDNEGKMNIAIIDGKSKTSGTVTHSDISDVAIETHKEKNGAEYVAIVGPGFGGDTIKNHARKKGFALITDGELIDIVRSYKSLGLSLTELSMMFKVPNGLAHINEKITSIKRERDIITLVISTFRKEQDAMDSLSARDLYFLLRGTDLSPTLEELINAFDTLSKEEIGVLSLIKKSSSAENTTYALRGEKYCINRLRSLANAIESGIT